MSSGQVMAKFFPHDGEPGASSYPSLDLRNNHPVLSFVDNTEQGIFFTDYLPANYSNGGLTVLLIWAGATATTGDAEWKTRFERLEDGGTDIDADSFAAAEVHVATTQGTSGALKYSEVPHTHGAEIDNIVADELFRLKVTREAASGSDTMSGNAQLLAVIILET